MADIRYLDKIETQELITEIKRRLNKISDSAFAGTQDDWDSLTPEQQNQYTVVYITEGSGGSSGSSGSGSGTNSSGSFNYVVRAQQPGGEEYVVGNFWFVVNDNAVTNFTDLTTTNVSKIYRYSTNENSIIRWNEISPLIDSSEPPATKGKTWIKTEEGTGKFIAIYSGIEVNDEIVWKEIYPEPDETLEIDAVGIYINTLAPIMLGTFWIDIISEEDRTIEGVYKYILTDGKEQWELVYKAGSGGVGEWIDDGHTAEIFNCYKDTDYLERNSTNARYDHIEGAGNKSTFDGDDFNYDGYNHVEGNHNTLRNCYDTHVGGYANEVGKSTNGNENSFVYGSRNICDDIAKVFVSGSRNQISNVDDSAVFGEDHAVSGDADGMLVSGGGNTVTGGMYTTVLGNHNTVEDVNHSLVVGQNIRVTNQKNSSLFCGSGYTIESVNPSVVFCAGYGSDRFIINNDGSFYTTTDGDSSKKFEVNSAGQLTATNFSGNGADYAEYFEWTDGNQSNDDRCGMLVMLSEDKILPANGNNIIGAVSARASVVGNAYENYWHGKYVTDVYGRSTSEISPDFDPNKTYIPRSQRPEWDVIGLVGRLVIRDDGSCKVNQYVTAVNGIGTNSSQKTNIRVLRRLDENHIEVIIR